MGGGLEAPVRRLRDDVACALAAVAQVWVEALTLSVQLPAEDDERWPATEGAVRVTSSLGRAAGF